MNEFETVLLTTDLSEASRHAFGPALAIARAFHSKLIMLYVVEDRLPLFVDELTAMPVEGILESQRRRAVEELEKFAAGFGEAGIEIERLVACGTPHVEIVRLARERGARLLVMATHGRGFMTHALFGSTTARVLRRAPCPVLTVRSPEHPGRS